MASHGSTTNQIGKWQLESLIVTSFNKLYAHDETKLAQMGDLVRIQETRPLSKLKSWRLVEVLNPDGSPKA